MATAGVGLASAAGAFTGIPYVGWAVGLAAAIIDQTVLYPALAGDGPEEARVPQLANLPESEQGVGSPRTFALGARLRVPAHILYQSSKVREETAGGGKGGTSVTLQRVYVNALVHLNDRESESLQQLIGNGQLLLFKDRNLIFVTTENQSAAVSGSSIVFSMTDTLDPSYEDSFEVGDICEPSGFVYAAGPTEFNNTYYEVTAVTGHTATTVSTMTVVPIDGQSVTNLSYTGGTPFNPARVTRVDDAVAGSNVDPFYTVNLTTPYCDIRSSAPEVIDPGNVFGVGDQVTVRNLAIYPLGSSNPADRFTVPANLYVEQVLTIANGTKQLRLGGVNPLWLQTSEVTTLAGGPAQWGPSSGGGLVMPGEEVIVDFQEGQSFTIGVFDSTFNPDTHYNNGDQFQAQPRVLVDDFGANNTGRYRGQTTQGLVDCYVSVFGDQLPSNLEAIIEIDPILSWPQALEAVLQRANLRNTQINVDLVRNRPFRGAYVRGAVPIIRQLQPLLVAGQILVQDRNGVLTLYDLDNADSVQIENGVNFTDLGVRVDGQRSEFDKISVSDKPETDLPTSVGVRFQDPDNGLSIGYEHFGLRNPDGVDHVNEQKLDLASMSLSRREARDLATTIMRRAWVNRRTYRLTLPAAYLHLLENDLITFTDDEGNDVVARVIQRDIGANYVVKVTALAERTQLAVTGSPVQTAGTYVPQTTPAVQSPLVVPMDAVATSNNQINIPGLRLAIVHTGAGLMPINTIWQSVNGTSYVPAGTVSGTAAGGVLLGDLSAQTASEVYGTTTVTVRSQSVSAYFVNQGTDPITSATQAQAESGKNWCALVSSTDPTDVEIAAFLDFTDNGDGTVTLANWLRGLRGTNPKLRGTDHYIVLLNQSTAGWFFSQYPSVTPTSVAFKSVPAGGDINLEPAYTFSSPEFNNARPLPVRAMTRVYNATAGTTRFYVEDNTVPTHWERAILPLGTQPPHTMDEPIEHYRIRFYSNAGFDVLVDSVELEANPSTGSNTLRDRWFDWPDARASFAGYTPSATETYNIGVIQVGQFGDGPEAQFVVG